MEPMTDTEAADVALEWSACAGSPLDLLAKTGEINMGYTFRDGARSEILEALEYATGAKKPPFGPARRDEGQVQALRRLRSYVMNHGNRPPVPGWRPGQWTTDGDWRNPAREET